MINFFKKKDKEKTIANDDKSYSNIAALLIHVAKIDNNYEDKEKEIIKRTLIELGATSSNITKLISDASLIEENSKYQQTHSGITLSQTVRVIDQIQRRLFSSSSPLYASSSSFSSSSSSS